MSSSVDIAIVIPYFKPDFLDLLLVSLQSQREARVSIYLFDDCSATPADKIAEKYSGMIKKHIRFDRNLGSESITSQWDRCLSHIGKEEWVWFIPDDDVVKPGTLARVSDAVRTAGPEIALIHLSTEFIDDSGRNLGFCDTLPPDKYNVAEFYYRVLRGETMITLGSQIYRRSALGSRFIEFPRGWGSDHATTLKCAENGIIHHIEDATLKFRMSEVNISSQTDDWQQKAEARVQFAGWLVSFLSSIQDNSVSPDQVCDAFLMKGESFFVRACPLHWYTVLTAYKTAKAVGSGFALVYSIKIVLIKALNWIRRQ